MYTKSNSPDEWCKATVAFCFYTGTLLSLRAIGAACMHEYTMRTSHLSPVLTFSRSLCAQHPCALLLCAFASAFASSIASHVDHMMCVSACELSQQCDSKYGCRRSRCRCRCCCCWCCSTNVIIFCLRCENARGTEAHSESTDWFQRIVIA